MSTEEIVAWCAEGGIDVGQHRGLSFKNKRRIEIPFPERLFAAPLILLELVEDLTTRSSSGSLLLWIRDTGIWDERLDQIGLPQLEILNRATQTDGNDTSPGYLFDEREIHLCVGAAVLPMLYGWDAYLIPKSREHFLYLSHDEFIGIYYKNVSDESEFLKCYRDLALTAYELT